MSEDMDFLYNDKLGAKQVECPDCSTPLVHPIKVVVNRGGEITTVNDEGTKITRDRPADGGVLIVIHYACEDGHVFGVYHQFAGGGTFTGTKSFGWFGPRDEDDDSPHFRTIWRD